VDQQAGGAVGKAGLQRDLVGIELRASIDLDRLVDQIVALVDGFGLQGVLDPQREQLASRLNGAVDALIRAADGPTSTSRIDKTPLAACDQEFS
jgi:hypothetical protein